MRHLPKSDTVPPILAEYRTAQERLGYNLGYDCFSRAGEFLNYLVTEQHGICGYTGVALDDRLVPRREGTSAHLKPHIEHLKSQSACRQELRDQGLTPGLAWGEDMDHRNMIAALEVTGAKSEEFGARQRENRPLPV